MPDPTHNAHVDSKSTRFGMLVLVNPFFARYSRIDLNSNAKRDSKTIIISQLRRVSCLFFGYLNNLKTLETVEKTASDLGTS